MRRALARDGEPLDRDDAAVLLRAQLDDLLADLPGTDLSQHPGRTGESPPLPERRGPGEGSGS